jgi:MinD-like ATPase involved in chromosome partitioning or flagellar assembly
LAIQAAYSSPGSVLLIDANFAWPSVHNTFRVDRSPGLIDVIKQRVSPQECIQPSAVQQVFVLASGSGRPAISYELGVLREFLIAAKHDYDWVFVDLGCADEGGSPMVPFDSLDGVLLVVEAERVRSDFAKAVCDELRREGAAVLGVVMNKVRQHFPRWLDRRI